MENKITRINGVEISAVMENGDCYLPIKPICEAIGVNFATQYAKIKEDKILSSTVALRTTVGGDGKDREMVCLPLKYVYGWLFTINPENVKTEARETVERYRRECYDALYEHFSQQVRRTIEANQTEITLLNRLNSAIADKKDASRRIKETEKMLVEVRAERLDPQPSQFD